MFNLTIVFILIFGGNVGFLTNDFVWGKLLCQKDDIVYMHESDKKHTYHTFQIPEGWDSKNCIISVWGDGLIYPSMYDMVSREL